MKHARAAVRAQGSYYPIFVTGAMGAGTSLIAYALEERSAVAGVADESAHRIDRRSRLAMERSSVYGTSEEYVRLLRTSGELGCIATERYYIDKVYRRECRKRRGYVVDKAPNTHLVHWDLLNRCYPGSPLLVVVRPPEATIEGIVRKWPQFDLEAAIELYDLLYSEAEILAAVDARVSLVGYERFVHDYPASAERLVAKVGLPAAEGTVSGGSARTSPGKNLRCVEGSRIRVRRDLDQSARDRLPPASRATVLEKLGPLYERLCAYMDG